LLVGDGNTTQCDTLSVFMKENPNCSNKKPLIQLLSQASVCLKPEYCTMLPSWHEVVDLYGNKPIVLGTEICATYQKLIRGHDPMPKIAGLWNTGTLASVAVVVVVVDSCKLYALFSLSTLQLYSSSCFRDNRFIKDLSS
jgi:hypothetical protein